MPRLDQLPLATSLTSEDTFPLWDPEGAPNQKAKRARFALLQSTILAGIAQSHLPSVTATGGAIARSFGDWFADAPRTLRSLGCVPGGVIDCSLAFVAALALGVPLNGEGLVYGVSGSISMPAGTTLEYTRLKQLTPNTNDNLRTLTSSNVDDITLREVWIDRNGSGAWGSNAAQAGVYIVGGKGHFFDGVRVTGNNKGNGIAFINVRDSYAIRLRVHDMRFDDPAATEAMQGIFWSGCTGFLTVGGHVENLHGNATGDLALATIAALGTGKNTNATRGYAVAGCTDCHWIAPNARLVDQGFDITGGAGNLYCTITGGTMEKCFSFGWKLANSAVGCTISNAIARECGLAGFVAAGGSQAASTPKTSLNNLHNCKAINTGSPLSGDGGEYSDNTPSGFIIYKGETNLDYPRFVTLTDCVAIDDQTVKTMRYGAFCDAISGAYPGNALHNFKSHGHILGTSTGFSAAIVRATLAANQSHTTSGVYENVNFTAETFDRGLIHDNVTNPHLFTAPEDGFYRFWGKLTFAGNATGVRYLRVMLNGVLVTGSIVLAPASGNETTIEFDELVSMTAGQTLALQAFQTSGAALDIRSDSTAAYFAAQTLH